MRPANCKILASDPNFNWVQKVDKYSQMQSIVPALNATDQNMTKTPIKIPLKVTFLQFFAGKAFNAKVANIVSLCIWQGMMYMRLQLSENWFCGLHSLFYMYPTLHSVSTLVS